MPETFDVEFEFATWYADPDRNLLRTGGREVRLEPRTMELLVFLLRHAGQVVSKRETLKAIWGAGAATGEALVVAIYELRKALGDRASRPTFIETIPRRGYRWLAPVTVVARDADRRGPARHRLLTRWRAARLAALVLPVTA